MGNRARDIINRLCEAGLISEKRANLPRQVLIRELGEIPEKILNFLQANNVSLEEIKDAFTARRANTHSKDILTADEGGD